jgi:hypothetical protein
MWSGVIPTASITVAVASCGRFVAHMAVPGSSGRCSNSLATSELRARAATAATHAITGIVIGRTAQRRVAVSVVMPARAHGDWVSLDDAVVCKAGRIHAVIGRKAPANIESNESGLFPCCLFGGLQSGGLILAVVNPDNASISSYCRHNRVSGLWPVPTLA